MQGEWKVTEALPLRSCNRRVMKKDEGIVWNKRIIKIENLHEKVNVSNIRMLCI